MKQKHLSHKEWVKAQKLDKTFRDVLIHASLIESIIINESIKNKCLSKKEIKTYRSFGNAVTILDKNKIIDIYNLKERRNKLMHDIFKEELNQDQIEKIRDEIFDIINKIYKESEIVKKYI